ncbi:ArnT family glycosyltransferase [Flavobacterium beibuense]|uniref:PMT_2 domain containing protein n=1 Tax=Flavobacterium beibuense TaxID=657326 RepID=A0A444W7K5_9FLAO|nr:glycosyltransferase family 39 protein [Flavobacterium beibuense]RYJ41867.1 PMT_2 domain containing protein [Flavobacterium beibuense]
MISNIVNNLTKKPIATIIAFCFISRLIIVLLYQNITIFSDSSGYTELAERLANFSLQGYLGTHSPGYPILLALSGNSLIVAVVLQFVLGTINAVYQYKTLRLLNFTTKTSLITTLLFNSLLHVIFYETNILTESFTLFFVTLIFYFIIKGLYTEYKLKNSIILSLLIGFLILIKPLYIFLPFLIYGFYTLKNFSFSKIINIRLTLLIFPLVSFLGWSYVNKVNTGYFVSTTFWGINIAQNCVYFAEKCPEEYKEIGDTYADYREKIIAADKDVAMTIWFAGPELMGITKLSYLPDFSAKLSEYSKATIKKNPIDYSKQMFVSWRDFWDTSIYWNYKSFKVPHANQVLNLLWLAQSFLLYLIKLIFVLLIPYHIVQFFRKKEITTVIIITTVIFAASILQAMVTYGSNSRFSYPFEFLMIVVLLFTFGKRFRLT